MTRYIFKRLLWLVPVLLGIVTVVFIVMRVFAPDPAALMLGKYATGAKIAALQEKLGLNQPLYFQYYKYLIQLLHGDFGKSVFSKSPVLYEIMARFPATIELAFVSIFLASLSGIVIGIISAVKQNTIFDYVSMFSALIGVSLPIFWLALLMILLFSVQLGWLPVSGRIDILVDLKQVTGFYLLDSVITGNLAAFISSLKHIILPALSLAVGSMAIIARMTRSSMLEIVRQDYIKTARAKGLAEKVVIIKHALKNSLIPVTTVIGLQLGALLGGAVLTETIFSWPGVGYYIVSGIQSSDYPVVQAGAILIASSFVLINLLVDVFYGYLDPRIRYNE